MQKKKKIDQRKQIYVKAQREWGKARMCFIYQVIELLTQIT